MKAIGRDWQTPTWASSLTENLAGQFDHEIIDPTTGAPFPDNRIPVDRFDAVMGNVAPFYPAPNREFDPSLNYGREGLQPSDRDEIHAKVDIDLTESDRMFAKYSWVENP